MTLFEKIVAKIKLETGAEDYRCTNAALGAYNLIRHYDQKKRASKAKPRPRR